MKKFSSSQVFALLQKPILFDASIFMVGIKKRATNSNFEFEHMKQVFIEPIMLSFENILIHADVFDELDVDSKAYIKTFVGKNVTLVDEVRSYDFDPLYNQVFAAISGHDIFLLKRKSKEHLGEISSLSYAAYHGIQYFCANDTDAAAAVDQLPELSHVEILPLAAIFLFAYCYHNQRGDKTHNVALKSMYKEFAKRKGIYPDAFSEFLHKYLR